jgi:branched-chain amino acid transport system ATP-binding protein
VPLNDEAGAVQTNDVLHSGPGLGLTGIGVRFGGLRALDDVSLTVAPERIVGVIGPNGAGKTTLFNVVCGLVRPSHGQLTWDSAPLHPRPHRLARLGIGRTLQSVRLFPGLTVLENVLVGGESQARSGFLGNLFALPHADHDERRLRAAALDRLERLGVAGYAHQFPVAVPYAAQKRVALARALIARPRLLLLDEPAAGLSADEIEELAALIRALPRDPEAPCAVMLVEHHMDLVMAVCDEILVLDFGRVIAHGSPVQIKASGAVTAAYLGAAEATGGPA